MRCTCKQDKCAHAAAACFCLEQRDSSVIFDSDIMDTDSSLDNIIRSYVDPEAETPEEKNEPVSLVP